MDDDRVEWDIIFDEDNKLLEEEIFVVVILLNEEFE